MTKGHLSILAMETPPLIRASEPPPSPTKPFSPPSIPLTSTATLRPPAFLRRGGWSTLFYICLSFFHLASLCLLITVIVKKLTVLILISKNSHVIMKTIGQTTHKNSQIKDYY